MQPYPRTIDFLAAVGDTDALSYMYHMNGCPQWNESACALAAYGGHIDTLKFITKGIEPGKKVCEIRDFSPCPWDEWTIRYAIKQDHIDCLEYALDNGCPHSVCEIMWAISYGSVKAVACFEKRGLLGNGTNLCAQAAAKGRLDILKYFRSIGKPWDARTCANAAGDGHIDCLQYARVGVCLTRDSENLHTIDPCPWDDRTLHFSCSDGHLDCLKYAFENGCNWDGVNIYGPCEAARNGHLECLKYAMESGAPYSKYILESARRGGHDDCITYAVDVVKKYEPYFLNP